MPVKKRSWAKSFGHCGETLSIFCWLWRRAIPNGPGKLNAMDFQIALRSHPPAVDPFLNCLLIDTTGKLHDWYGAATLVFIGKSLLARGGQNPAEAILAGKPVVFGPHMENFAALANSLVAHGGATQVNSPTELRQTMAHLLANPDEREKMVENARQVLETHRGATASTA